MPNKKQLVIIPAAGKATRLRPITSGASKAMVPVAGKPCIDWILERFDPVFCEIIVVTGDNSDLPEYLNRKWPAVHHCPQSNYQCSPNPVDAIATAYDDRTHNNIMEYSSVTVWLGDTIIDPSDDLQQFYRMYKPPVCIVGTSPVDDPGQWCVVDADGELHDKPWDRTISGPQALIGIYHWNNVLFFDRAMHEFYTDDNEYEISDLIRKSGAVVKQVRQGESWRDIGQLHTYYESNAKLLATKSRAFNKISVDTRLGTISKTSTKPEILAPEIAWYSQLTDSQRHFVPRIWQSASNKITMSLEPGVLLSDVLVYDDLPYTSWAWIINKILMDMDTFFWSAGNNLTGTMPLQAMWKEKSLCRLDPAAWALGTRRLFVATMNAMTKTEKNSRGCAYIHGDLHTGNILFDFGTGSFKIIDPRGEWKGIPMHTTAGDQWYDLAKLAHDFYIGYSAAVANQPINRIAQQAFRDCLGNFLGDEETTQLILDAGMLLVATCVPLHSDDPARQERLIKLVEDYYEDRTG